MFERLIRIVLREDLRGQSFSLTEEAKLLGFYKKKLDLRSLFFREGVVTQVEKRLEPLAHPSPAAPLPMRDKQRPRTGL